MRWSGYGQEVRETVRETGSQARSRPTFSATARRGRKVLPLTITGATSRVTGEPLTRAVVLPTVTAPADAGM